MAIYLNSVSSPLKQLLAICMVSISLGSYAQPVLTLTTPDITATYFHTDDYQGLGDQFLKEALSRIGYGLKVTVLPAERSLLMADSGEVDGELLRTRGIENQYPDLVRVSESVVDIEFVVFSHQPTGEIKNWESLKGRTVAMVTGMKIIEENMPQTALVTNVKNGKQLFELLKKRRVEYAVFSRHIGEDFLKRSGIAGISAGQSTLSSVPTYTYLNKKHQHMAEKLANSLREMKNDGTFQAILEKHQP